MLWHMNSIPFIAISTLYISFTLTLNPSLFNYYITQFIHYSIKLIDNI